MNRARRLNRVKMKRKTRSVCPQTDPGKQGEDEDEEECVFSAQTDPGKQSEDEDEDEECVFSD